MKPNKRLAAGLAAAMAVGGMSVIALGATSAQAVTGNTATIHGSPANGFGVVWYDNGSVPMDPVNPGPNRTVSLTAQADGADLDFTLTLSGGPNTSAAAAADPNSYRLDAFVRLDGSPNTRGTRFTGPIGTVAVPANSPTFTDGVTITGTFPGAANAAHTLTLTDLLLDSNGPSSGGGFGTPTGFDAFYNAGTTTATIVTNPTDWPIAESYAPAPTASISSVVNGSTTVPAAATPAFRVGDVLNVTGNDLWTASSAVRATICTSPQVVGTASGCAPPGTESSLWSGYTPTTWQTNAGGQLPNISLTSAGIGSYSGANYVVIWQGTTPGGGFAPANFTKVANIPVQLLTTRTVEGPTIVSPGAGNAITGAMWYPGETVTIGTNGTDATSTVVAGPTGAISLPNYVVNDTSATEFTASGIGGNATSAEFSFSQSSCSVPVGGDCSTSQTILAEVTAGVLQQAAATTGGNPNETTIELGSIETDTTANTLSGDLNTITVTDTRGGTLGWSLVGELNGDLVAGGNSIAADNLTIDGAACVGDANSASGATAAAAGADFGGAVTLCTKNTTADNPGGSTGGVYTVSSGLDLNVPAFQAPGNYSAVMTVTLS